MTRYRYATTLSFGTDGEPDYAEVEVEVSYTVAWGSPGTGRPYYGPVELYDEGSPDEVEDIRLELVEGRPRPFPRFASDRDAEMLVIEALSPDDIESMLQEARDREAAWADDAADYRASDMRKDRP